MDLRHLRALVAVVEAGGFARAAARLGIGQPALSRQVGVLERELGVRLFDRLGRRVELTADGEDLVRRSRRVLDEADAVVDRARALTRGDTGVLRVGATPQMIEHLLTPFLAHHRRRHPGVEVHLVEDGTARPAPHALVALVQAGYGTAVLPSTARVPAGDLRVAALLQNGAPLGGWAALSCNAWRGLPRYAERFGVELEAYARRAYPGRAVVRRAPRVPRPPDPGARAPDEAP